MIDAEKILRETYPDLKLGQDNKLAIKLAKKLLHEADFNQVIEKNQHLRGFAFLDKLLNYFKFSYQVSPKSYNNIPSEGGVLIVANQVLSYMEPLQSVFLTVDVLSKKASHKQAYKAMLSALENEEAVIIFPAGEVSRITPKGIRDGVWKTGFVKLAKKANCPVLPIHIKASNSALFYGASTFYKPLGTLLLVKEMFNKKHQELKFTVGSPIPYQAFSDKDEANKELSQLFRKHVINLEKKNKKPLFSTIETVVHPVNSKALKKALYQSQLLGETKDGKKIFLYQYQNDCPVMLEIARLRELTFRTVEEGTGENQNLDKYDVYYSHLVLWDENDLEIVGSYRIGEGNKIMAAHGVDGFYTHTFFDFKSAFQKYLPYSIELGRSFVQPRYWGQRSLDYLWYGIGAYLRNNPEIKYLFGPVSMSNAYPQQAKEVIISFYQQQFGSQQALATAKQPFIIPEQTRQFAESEFNGDYKTSYKILNTELKKNWVSRPQPFINNMLSYALIKAVILLISTLPLVLITV